MADFPLEEIAKHAGMEVGTLYRRFPTREPLWVANINSHFLAPAETRLARASDLTSARPLVCILKMWQVPSA